MFPDAEDAPAGGAEVGGDFFVTGAVAAEFLVPEGAVGGGAGLVFGAGMPEAAVEEDGEFEFGEDEIWGAGRVFPVSFSIRIELHFKSVCVLDARGVNEFPATFERCHFAGDPARACGS